MRLCFGCLFACFLFFVTINATNRYVPIEYNSIQAALNVSSSGDTVFVAPGVYSENIVWTLVDGIVLKSTGNMLNTIIDANRNGRGIGFVSSFNNPTITSATKVDGFTVRNGYSNLNGAGIICYFASPEINNCIITHNECTSMGSGGGLYCYGANPHLNNVYIVRNTAYSGGGAHIDPMSSPIFNNCVIADNTLSSPGGSYAAGIYGRYEVYFQLNNCTITRNSYLSTAAIHLGEVCSPVIQHSTITDNTYGIMVMHDAGLTIHNNNFVNNSCGIWHNDEDGDVINVTNNWWGSDTGPIHINNPAGLGDSIWGNADFNNWFLVPDATAPLAPPTGMQINNVTQNSITLSWGYEANPNIDHFVINYGSDSLAVIQANNVTTNNMIYTVNNLIPNTKYFLQVAVVYNDNKTSWYSECLTATPGNVSAEDFTTLYPDITSNYPNPFSKSTRICYDLKQSGFTSMNIYNIKGELIRHLINTEQDQGITYINWNAVDDNNNPVAAGMYFLQLRQNGLSRCKKLIYVK